MKLNLGAGRYPLDGFENLNEPEWRAERGLLVYPGNCIDAITVSHLLMYLDHHVVGRLLSECHRVLIWPGGVLRITEDETNDPASERRGGMPGAIYLTNVEKLMAELAWQGFAEVLHCTPDATRFKDDSLIQQHHGRPPHVFHVEAIK